MKYVLSFLGMLAVLVPTFGKSYFGDTTLASKKFDQLTILGVANLDGVTATEISITGPMTAATITANAIEVIGPVKLIKSHLKKVLITGPVSLNKVKSDTVTITGYSDFTDVSISKSLTITGMLNASHSRFNTVTLTMSESVLKDSLAKSIVVKCPDSDESHQKLMFYGNTRVDMVEFESGHGEVHVYGKNVKVGKVKGAEVIQH
jgi:hypothetical protein